jgi:hypothetical protein
LRRLCSSLQQTLGRLSSASNQHEGVTSALNSLNASLIDAAALQANGYPTSSR